MFLNTNKSIVKFIFVSSTDTLYHTKLAVTKRDLYAPASKCIILDASLNMV